MTQAAQLDVDFADPAVIADPFPVYEEIRAAGRVVWNEVLGAWMVPGFHDCVELLSNTDGARFGIYWAERPGTAFWFDTPNMVTAEGGEHRRFREGFARFFIPAAIARRWEPRVREAVDEALSPLTGGVERFDVVDALAKVPGVILAELLGVPERQEDFKRWSNAVVRNIAFGREQPESRRVVEEAVAELNGFLTEEMSRHRHERPDDLLTVIGSMPGWTEDECRSSAGNLLLAGHALEAMFLGASVVALAQHPEQRRLLVENPMLVPNAVEEILRCAGPVQVNVRVVVHETELAGTRLAAGDVVFALLMAANRDPARWSDPEQFDVCREFQPNLGFGLGPHICIGAPLARLQARIAIEALLRVAPDYRLGEVDYGSSFFIRGPEHGMIDKLAVPAIT